MAARTSGEQGSAAPPLWHGPVPLAWRRRPARFGAAGGKEREGEGENEIRVLGDAGRRRAGVVRGAGHGRLAGSGTFQSQAQVDGPGAQAGRRCGLNGPGRCRASLEKQEWAKFFQYFLGKNDIGLHSNGLR